MGRRGFAAMIAAAAVAGAPGAARGEPGSGAIAAEVLGWLHRTNSAAIEGGELAAQKSTSARVRQLAAQLVGDHTALEQEVGALAAAHGLELPGTGASAPGDDASQGLAALEDLRGGTFDAAFLRWVADQGRQGATQARSAQARAQQSREPALTALLDRLAPQLEARAQAARAAQRPVAARTPPSARRRSSH
ncbi:MAG TPA: DUF4142 domain-containing protein [Anaeromyxobacteraceae bacterium]|nr:DUF4142 domain-containing protein [Anaeromyxobacteraceae bacterium]